MKSVGRHIPGFPTDLVSPGKLRERLESALTLGYKKQTSRRYKQAAMHIRELYIKMGMEYLTRNPDIKERSMAAAIIKLRGASRLRPLNVVAVLHTLFPDEFEATLPKMMENTANKVDLLEGIGSSDELDDLDKAAILLGIHQKARYTELRHLLKAFCLRVAESRDIPSVETDHELVLALHKEDERDRLPILVQYLLNQPDWERKEIRAFVDYAAAQYYEQEVHQVVENASHEKHQMTLSHKQQKDQWENEKVFLNQQLDALQTNATRMEKELKEVDKDKAAAWKQLESGKQQWANDIYPLQQWLALMTELVSEPIMIICDDPHYLLARLLKHDVIPKDKLLSIGKTKWKTLNNHLFFVVRYSIGTSQEWNQIKILFETNHITYYELTGYSELEHMIQLLTCLIYHKEPFL